MGDPELVARAQRAAVRLERSWDRWRRMHGLAAEQAQPVSSYVGYSLAEPWGRPRVVFGVGAEEAERLSDLLEQEGADPRYDQGLLWEPEPQSRLPQGQLPQGPLAQGQLPQGQLPQGQLRDHSVNGVQSPARAAQNGHAEPVERRPPGDWAQARQGDPASVGWPQDHSPVPAAPDDWTQSHSADTAETGAWAQAPTVEPASAGAWTQGHRTPEPAAPGEWAPGHPALHQASEPAESPEPNSASSLSADMAGWTSGELPGQAAAGLAAWPQPGMPPAGDPDQNVPPQAQAGTDPAAAQHGTGPANRQVPAAPAAPAAPAVPAIPATPGHREPETRAPEGDSGAQEPAAWLRLA
jgi:hypothetical protein